MRLPRHLPTSLLRPAIPTARPLPPQCHLLTHNPIIRPALASLSPPPQQPPTIRAFSTTSPKPTASPFRLTSTPNPKNPPPTATDASPAAPEPNHDDPNANAYASPYKPKRQWPPDMSKLSPKHQFRLERKYRRRAALKYARPKWTKFTKLVQWFSIGFVLVYAMLFMEWDEKGSPFDEIRKAVFGGLKEAFSTPAPPRPVREAAAEKDRE
ncbi:hypothetical protein BO86DRAFT_386025 [Aspergillus japonicus CBS 114.51]|uniref:Uncharacterized protein n=2 Tax=Aspergillus TaxID=5052 RepID=A0A2V5HLW0_ASPV1|nr:hypothetical protein BO86DRAFT_386025 [Aspergillus japonicus CBS 114.51]PYI22493.1 hypothetical protein BO99DRAFT_471335 [Aspergillus violaceofuscus CBS 115571]RAH85723.1 hypothetical protein BO86DRAFT_386025 [Aspergillus japonicus CBS 114.51]